MKCEDAMAVMGVDAGPHEIVQAERHLEGCDRCRAERARRSEAEAWIQALEIPEDSARVSQAIRKVASELRRENLEQTEREEGSPLRGAAAFLDSFVLAFQWLFSGEGTCPDCMEEYGSRPAACAGCRQRARRTARATITPPAVMRGAAVGFGAMLSAVLLAQSMRVEPGAKASPTIAGLPPPPVTSVKIAESSLASVLAHNPPIYDPIVPQPKDERARDAYNEAYLIAHGIGGEPEPVKVFKLLSLSADHGSAEALYQLGQCFRGGYGTDASEPVAFKHFLLAAEAGHPWAKLHTGIALAKGIGVSADHAGARIWLERALLDGVLEAAPHLAGLHESGMGGSRDDSLIEALDRLPVPDPDSPSRKYSLPIWKQELNEKFKGK